MCNWPLVQLHVIGNHHKHPNWSVPPDTSQQHHRCFVLAQWFSEVVWGCQRSSLSRYSHPLGQKGPRLIGGLCWANCLPQILESVPSTAVWDLSREPRWLGKYNMASLNCSSNKILAGSQVSVRNDILRWPSGWLNLSNYIIFITPIVLSFSPGIFFFFFINHWTISMLSNLYVKHNPLVSGSSAN